MSGAAARSSVAAVTLVVLGGCASTTSPLDGPSSPGDAQFVSSDIDHFWVAYANGGSGGDAGAFQRLYLDQASAGLNDFKASRHVTGASLAAMVRASPRYFASIRGINRRLLDPGDAVLSRIRANYGRIKAVYPAAVFPPVTFLLGRFSTGGTTSSSGILIGTEFYALSPEVPVDELDPFARANVQALDSLPIIIAHEHTHVLQARGHAAALSGDHSLLAQALMEGSADFVGELVSGGNSNAKVRAYALSHEAELWAEFQRDMNGTDVSRWLYNQGSATGERPGDLGYFIGYRICEAYYRSVADATQAVKEIIEMRDARAFLTGSGYSLAVTARR